MNYQQSCENELLGDNLVVILFRDETHVHQIRRDPHAKAVNTCDLGTTGHIHVKLDNAHIHTMTLKYQIAQHAAVALVDFTTAIRTNSINVSGPLHHSDYHQRELAGMDLTK